MSFIVLSLEATKELALVYSPLITSTIVEPHSSQAEQSAIELYQEITGTGKPSAELKEAILAASYRRIKQLFISLDVVQQ